MRQVPVYAIIGDGRVARHFCYYFDLIGISYSQWSRRNDPARKRLTAMVQGADCILVLLNDTAIESFIRDLPQANNKHFVHFSAVLSIPTAHCCHPLMTFASGLYTLPTYHAIPFILQQDGPKFSELMPGLPNPHYTIDAKLKAFYHSLCVMSANFTCILWQKFFTELEETFHLPKELLHPYLEQTFYNLKYAGESALTGPLSRNDNATIEKNLQALAGDPFQKIYQAFTSIYKDKDNV